MNRTSLLFVALVLCTCHTNAIADDPSKSQSPAITTQTDALPSGTGRYAMAPFNGALVLLDTASGDSWLLNSDSSSDSLSWLPITRGVTALSRTVVSAKPSASGRVEISSVPGTGVIVIKGKKEDVSAATEAIRNADRSDKNKSDTSTR